MSEMPECECFWVDPKYWTTHCGAVEPGSQMEWNPECPAHPPPYRIEDTCCGQCPGNSCYVDQVTGA